MAVHVVLVGDIGRAAAIVGCEERHEVVAHLEGGTVHAAVTVFPSRIREHYVAEARRAIGIDHLLVVGADGVTGLPSHEVLQVAVLLQCQLGVVGRLLPVLHEQLHAASKHVDGLYAHMVDRLRRGHVFQVILRLVEVGGYLVVDLSHACPDVILVFHVGRCLDRHARRGACRGRGVRLAVEVDEGEIICGAQVVGLAHDVAQQRAVAVVVARHVLLRVDHHVAIAYLLIGQIPILGLAGYKRALALEIDPSVALPTEEGEISAGLAHHVGLAACGYVLLQLVAHEVEHGIVWVVEIIHAVLYLRLAQRQGAVAHEQLVEVGDCLHAAQVLRVFLQEVGRAGACHEQERGDKKSIYVFCYMHDFDVISN